MRMHFVLALAAALLIVPYAAIDACAAEEGAPDPGPFQNIYVIDFDGEVDPMLRVYMDRRIDEAIAAKADCIIFRVNSPGGRVGSAREIGDRVFRIPEDVHTVAWVPRMALSAAAFISLACDEIIMGPEASLGDSQPIMSGGQGKPDPVGEKLESPLRAWFRNYAQKNGYPPLLAEAMVSASLEVVRVRTVEGGRTFYLSGETLREAKPDDVIIESEDILRKDVVQVGNAVVSKNRLLTLTPEEAATFGFVKRRFNGRSIPKDEDEVFRTLQSDGGKITAVSMNFYEKAGRWLLALAGMLSALVAIAVLVTLWQGPGTITIVGICALVLILLIYGTVDQLNGFPLFLVLLGAALFAAEVFLIPGFGVAGVLGMVSMATGFLFLAFGATWEDTGNITQDGVLDFGLQFVVTTILGFLLVFTMSRFFPKIGPAKRMVLAPPGGPSVGVDESDLPALGARGMAQSDLRPGGTARIAGEDVSVVSVQGFLSAGTALRVIRVEGNEVSVEEDDVDTSREASA